jgi:hypothetical protein
MSADRRLLCVAYLLVWRDALEPATLGLLEPILAAVGEGSNR